LVGLVDRVAPPLLRKDVLDRNLLVLLGGSWVCNLLVEGGYYGLPIVLEGEGRLSLSFVVIINFNVGSVLIIYLISRRLFVQLVHFQETIPQFFQF